MSQNCRFQMKWLISASHEMRIGEYGNGRKLSVSVVSSPAMIPGYRGAWLGFSGGGLKLASSIRAACHLGIRQGRFSGFAKKAKTSSTGCGSHCSAWKWEPIAYRSRRRTSSVLPFATHTSAKIFLKIPIPRGERSGTGKR